MPKGRVTAATCLGHQPAMGRCWLVAWMSVLAVGACGQVDSNPSGPPAANAGGASNQPAQGGAAGNATQPATSGNGSAGTATGGTAGASGGGAAGGVSGGNATGGASAANNGGSAGTAADALAGSAGEALGGAGGDSNVEAGINIDAGNNGILHLSPLPGPHPYRAIQVVAGRNHSCALLEDHRVKCWGRNGYGQLGLGDMLQRGLSPAQMGNALPTVDLGTGRTVLSIAAGRYTTCALLDDHSAKCWGLGVLGPLLDEIGDQPGEMGDALAPLNLGGHQAKAFGLGHYDACVALDDNSFFCGGTNAQFASVPAPSDGTHLLRMSHDVRALGLFDDGSLRYIQSGLLEPAMTELAKGDPVQLAAGSLTDHCVYRQSHQFSCLTSHSALPSQLPGARSIGVTEGLTLCAVLDSGELHCWGARSDLPFTERVGDEVRVKLPTAAFAVSTSGDDFQCALLVDGRVVCWDWQGAGPGTGEPGVGWNDVGATALQAVDLGTFTGH